MFRNPNPDALQQEDGEKRDLESNPLLAFGAESDPSSPAVGLRLRPTETAKRLGMRWSTRSAAAASLLVLAIGGVALARAGWIALHASAPQLATLTVESRPGGAEVFIDGQARGNSPLTVSLAAGAHGVTLRRGNDERVVPLTLTAGAVVTQYFELPPPESAVAHVSRISVVTDPPGARVHIDGQLRGASPLTVADLPVSEHKITVTSDTGSADRVITTEAGSTTSVVFSLPKVAAPIAGWLTVTAPFDVRIGESDNVVATGRSVKIMMPAGRHEISLANDSLQYQDARAVDVAAGKTTTLRIEPPKVSVSVNARPWADVLIDGTNVGQTPISNFPLEIGQHDVVFRHPQLGERRQTVIVTARGPNRIAVDLTK